MRPGADSTAEDDRKLDEEVSAILSGVVSSKDNYTTELDMYGGFTMETCLSFDPFMKTITTLTEKLLTLRETHKAYIEMKSRLDIHSVDWNTAEVRLSIPSNLITCTSAKTIKLQLPTAYHYSIRYLFLFVSSVVSTFAYT